MTRYLTRFVCGVAIFAASLSLAYSAPAQTAPASGQLLKGGVEYDVGTQTNIAQENQRHDGEVETIDGTDRMEDATHQLRLQQLEAMQSPLKPVYIAQENEHHADRKKEIAEKKSIEDGRHQKALADILAAAKSLLGGAAAGAAGAAAKALNSSGGGNPRGGAPQPSGPPPGYSGNPPPNPGSPSSGYSGNSPPPTRQPPNQPNPGPPPSMAGQKPPLQFIPDAINNIVNQVPNGSQVLQGTAEVSRAAAQAASDSITQSLRDTADASRKIAQAFEDQWTKNQWGGAQQVVGVFTGEAIGAGVQGVFAARAAAAGGAELGAAARAGGSAALRGSVLGGPNGTGALGLRGATTSGGGINGGVGENPGSPVRVGGGANGGAGAGPPKGNNGSPGGTGGGGSGPPPSGPGSSPSGDGGTDPTKRLMSMLEPGIAKGGGTTLSGNAIQENADNLAGKAVTLPASDDGVLPSPVNVQLGDRLGAGPTKFGSVYEIPRTPVVAKIMKGGKVAAEAAAARQARGYGYLNRNNIPTPEQFAFRQGTPEGPSYLLLENLNTGPSWAGKNVQFLNGSPTPAQTAASRKLLDDLGKNGLVWADPNQSNVFFFNQGGQLQAGILDPDMIFLWNEFGSQSEQVMGRLINSLMGRGGFEKVITREATAEDVMKMFSDKFYPQ
jgi:hypothetical protein